MHYFTAAGAGSSFEGPFKSILEFINALNCWNIFFKLERGRTLIENNIQMSFGKKVKTKKSGSRQKKPALGSADNLPVMFSSDVLSLAMASFYTL